MKKTAVFLFILSLAFTTVYGQNIYEGEKAVPLYIQNSVSTQKVTEIPLQKGETQGSVYLETGWQQGSLELNEGKVILGYPLKYNLKSGQLEIKATWDSIRIVHYSKVIRFTWEGVKGPEYFVNAKQFVDDNYDVNVNGFFKVLADGEAKLFQNSYLELIPSTYNTALDAGANHDTYTTKNKLYIYKDGKLSELKRNKKAVLSALSDREEEIKAYVKQNKLKYRKIEDVASMVNYYNNL